MTEHVPPRLQVIDLYKSFDTVPVLAGVSLNLYSGETHALLGENGSGKSTLVKILSGYHAADSGEILLDGAPMSVEQVRERVTVIHQDLGLLDKMSVLENIAVGIGFGSKSLLPIPRRRLRSQVREALDFIGSDLDLEMPVDDLTAPERTMVGVARAVIRLDPKRAGEAVFILDEPTAVATAEQAATIMKLMRDMAELGVSVMFITHRVAEALASGRVTVLRDGQVGLQAKSATLTEQDVIEAMLGRRMETFYPDKLPAPTASKQVLIATGVSGDILNDFDLGLSAGEVVGVTGLGGMGQDEVPPLLAATRKRTAGRVTLNGVPITDYVGAMSAGLAYVTGNRRRDGGWREGTAEENATLPTLRHTSKPWWINRAESRKTARRIMERTRVNPIDLGKHFGTFSGGNQQKLVLGKWLERKPVVLMLHEPTQGVDVGARRELLLLINEAARGGTAVLVCSADIEQLAEICHRVLVLSDGRVVTELRGGAVTKSAIMTATQLVPTPAPPTNI